MDVVKLVFLILATVILPPVGVFVVAGCGIDIFISVCLLLISIISSHIHAFYLIYIYYERRGEVKNGVYDPRPAPGIFSGRVLRGGKHVPVDVPVQPIPVPQPQPDQVPPVQAHETV